MLISLLGCMQLPMKAWQPQGIPYTIVQVEWNMRESSNLTISSSLNMNALLSPLPHHPEPQPSSSSATTADSKASSKRKQTATDWACYNCFRNYEESGRDKRKLKGSMLPTPYCRSSFSSLTCCSGTIGDNSLRHLCIVLQQAQSGSTTEVDRPCE
jgi:hypothetical protein